MTLLSILATIFGLGEGFSNIPQAYKIFKRQSAKDLSILTYSFQTTSIIIWLLYGIEIKSSPIIISNTFATLTILFVLYGWFLYGKEDKLKKKKNEN
ncbi:MAG: SemiSWEET family sugar transporter [Nanoarchaeota archaeon]